MDDAQSAVGPTLDDLRAKHAAAAKELADAEAKASAGPPKSRAQLEQEHEDAKSKLAMFESSRQAVEHARNALGTAEQRNEGVEAAQKAHDEALAEHARRLEANPELHRHIDIAAQRVIDAREALAAHQGE